MKSCQSITVQVLTEYCFPFQSITIYCNSLHFSAVEIICHAAHLLINMKAKWPAFICDWKIYHKSTLCNKFKQTVCHLSEDLQSLTKHRFIWIKRSETQLSCCIGLFHCTSSSENQIKRKLPGWHREVLHACLAISDTSTLIRNLKAKQKEIKIDAQAL